MSKRAKFGLLGGLAVFIAAASTDVLGQAAYRTITALDGQFCPAPESSAFWTLNPRSYAGGAEKARLIAVLNVRGTTALADNPILTLRPYVRSGGTGGECGAGTAQTFTRPRIADAPASVKIQKTTDGSTYTDYSAAVNDNSATTQADLDALSTIAASDWFVAGAPTVFTGFAADMDATNRNVIASVMSCEFWDGAAWAAVSNFTDGTASGGATLTQDGQVTWAIPSGWATSTINSISAYWARCGVSVTISAQVDVEELDIIQPIRAAVDLVVNGDDAGLLVESVSGGTGTLAYDGTIKVVWK